MDRGDLLRLANEALAAAGLTQLSALLVAETPEDFPLGVTGKALKRELRTRLSTLFAGV